MVQCIAVRETGEPHPARPRQTSIAEQLQCIIGTLVIWLQQPVKQLVSQEIPEDGSIFGSIASLQHQFMYSLYGDMLIKHHFILFLSHSLQ
jgi:hypothetical protein